MGVLIGSTSLISSADISPSPVSSPMVEPVPEMSGGNITIYYIVQYNGVSVYPAGTYLFKLSVFNGGNYVFVPTFPTGNSSNQRLYLTCSSSSPVVNVDIWNVSSGVLFESYSDLGIEGVNSISGLYNIRWRSGYFPRTTGIYSSDDFVGGYWILPENLEVADVNYPVRLNLQPFVTWSSYPPVHNQYHSHLSEPVADEFNRYFIIDNKLYWLSLRYQGLYILKDSIVTENSVESYSGDLVYGGSIISSGNINQVLVGQGSVLIQDREYYPVSISELNSFSSAFLYPVIYTSSSSVDIRLQLDVSGNAISFSGSDIYAEYHVFLSSFNLEDGSYIDSRFYAAEGDLSGSLTLVPDFVDNFNDIKCYGIMFYNSDNRQVNLSDVLWEYDVEFAQWRDDVRYILKDIYDYLSEIQSMPDAPTTAQWGNELDHAEPKPQVSPAEVQSIYNVAGNDLNQQLGDSAATLHEWVDIFSIPKLITLVAFSLTIGTAILILGKKKSE